MVKGQKVLSYSQNQTEKAQIKNVRQTINLFYQYDVCPAKSIR